MKKKNLNKNTILITLVALFMALCSILGIVATLPKTAKADTSEDTDVVESVDFTDLSNYTKKPIEYGTDISGKLVYMYLFSPTNDMALVAGHCLCLSSEVVYDSLSKVFRKNSSGTELTVDNASFIALKNQTSSDYSTSEYLITCTGDVVTFNDGAYSWNPANGVFSSGEVYGLSVRLCELVERTDTSEYIETAYTFGDIIPAGSIVRFKPVNGSLSSKAKIICFDGSEELRVDAYTESVFYSSSGVYLDAYGINRSEAFIDVYYGVDTCIAIDISSEYLVCTLTAPVDEEPTEQEPADEPTQEPEDKEPVNEISDFALWVDENLYLFIGACACGVVFLTIILCLIFRRR